MASFGTHLSFFFLLVLLLSPQIHAREGKFFTLFSHFRTKQPQVLLKKAKTPAPAPATTIVTVPASAPVLAPEFPILGPAPEAFFADKGDGYGLYGADPTAEYTPTKDTPTTTNFDKELLSEDFNGESYKTGYQKLPAPRDQSNHNNEMLYRNKYNGEEYTSNYNSNGYNKNYEVVDSNSNSNNQLNNHYHGNKREGMSDTRFVENGKYYYDVNNYNENENYSNVNVNKGYESGRGSSDDENQGYFDKKKYPNEYNTMEEYEKEQQTQRYIP